MVEYSFWVMRQNAPFEKLKIASTTTPQISFNSDAIIKRTLSIECDMPSDVNWLTDTLQAYKTIDGNQIGIGCFVVTTPTVKVGDGGLKTVSLECYDFTYRLSELAKLERTRTLPAGTEYLRAVTELLQEAGITMIMLDDAKKSAVTMTAKEWEIGTDLYSIVTELLNDINYCPLYFDGDGIARSAPIKEVVQDNTTHIYGAGQYTPIYIPMETSTDMFTAANVFIEVLSSADIDSDEPIIATAVNNNMYSSACVQRRGLRVPSIEIVDSIASVAELEVRAKNRMLQSMMSTESYSFTSDGDTETDHGLLDSLVLVREDAGLMQEQSWSINCVPGGSMTHVGKKVFYNID